MLDNMIESKSLTLEDLKRGYHFRNGFVYQQHRPTNSDKNQTMCESLIKGGFVTELPEFAVQLNPNILVFVYGEGVSFKSGEFFQKTNGIGSAMGLWQIDTLSGFLQDH